MNLHLSSSETHSLLSALMLLNTKDQRMIEKHNGTSLTRLYNKLVEYVNVIDVPVKN